MVSHQAHNLKTLVRIQPPQQEGKPDQSGFLFGTSFFLVEFLFSCYFYGVLSIICRGSSVG